MIPNIYLAELKWFVKGGYSIPQALQAATLTNARLLAMDDLIGSIQPGKLADVIVVDGRPDLDIDAAQGCDGVQGWPHDGEGRRGRHPRTYRSRCPGLRPPKSPETKTCHDDNGASRRGTCCAPCSGRKDIARALASAMIGNWFELFDFIIYGYFAAQIGIAMFPASDPVTTILSSLRPTASASSCGRSARWCWVRWGTGSGASRRWC
jgi:hypothetical protein